MNFSVFLAIFLMSFHAQAQISADYWQGGAIRIGPSASFCDTSTEGAVRYSSSGKILQFCDSSAWRNVGATAPSSDQTPDFFTFPNLTGQPVNTMIFSATVTVTGIDPDQTVNVTGAGAPQLRVNNGAWVGTASISAGDTLQIRLNSAASADTARQAVITLGTYTTNWTVTTRPGATIAFITSTTYTADFGGLAAADSICQNRANAASLPGLYKAVISDSSTDAKDHVTITYPVVNTAGDVMASFNFFGEQFTARALGENGSSIGDSGQTAVWGGTLSGGTKAAETCTDWTGVAGTGRRNRVEIGDIFQSAFVFSGGPVVTCANAHRIFCMQQ